jgi:hypothetical protein
MESAGVESCKSVFIGDNMAISAAIITAIHNQNSIISTFQGNKFALK